MMRNPLIAAFRFALRDSRSVFRNFKIFIASLFLGTAIIAGVGSVTANIADSIRQDGRIFLGGDVEISQIQQRLTPEERRYLSAKGTVSEIAILRSMAHVGADSSLVDLKAVDSLYPLYGALTLQNGGYAPDLLARRGDKWGILISDALGTRLNISTGAHLTLGGQDYQVRGILKKEPDGNNQGFQLAPGAIVSLEGLLASALIQPGSMVRYYNRIKLADSADAEAFKEELKRDFDGQTWRVRDSSSGGAGLRRFVSRMGQFMTLVGLTALLVGGVGVSNAVRAYLEGKTDSIATYKILGATGRTILIIYLSQILLIAALAIICGLMTGALMPLLLADILENSLPVDFNMAVYVKPVVLAAFYSTVVALIFTLWPLGKAVQIPAARLFRKTVSRRRTAGQTLPYIAAISGLVALLIAVVITTSDFPMVTAATLAAAAGAFLILTGAAALARMIAKNIPRPRQPLLRIALSNIHRPGNATSSIVLSLGLGLILFTSIALIEHNMLREINDRVSGEAPSFFFIDIQKNRQGEFVDYLAKREGVQSYRTVPNLRGRVTHVKSVKASEVKVKPEGRWILRGNRGVTFTAGLPKDNVIVAGAWWPADYQGPTQVSISRQMADSMDLNVGDKITVNILGLDFTAAISSVRSFDWESFGINYVMMFDPNSLKGAPFTYVATAKATPSEEDAIYRELTRKFPGVSVIRMKEVLQNANDLLGKISGAIDVMAAITILSGVIVLAGAIAAGHRRRIYDAAVLKVVGATRWDILKAYVIEFILLGALTGTIAIVLGAVSAYCVITYLMEMSWQLPFAIPVTTVAGSAAVTLLFGMASIWLAMSARPSQVLRNQ